MIIVSNEAEYTLQEILDNKGVPNYWKNQFEGYDVKSDTIKRGCFKELTDAGLIKVDYADNYPYFLEVLKDGYLYSEHKRKEAIENMPMFERRLTELIERTNSIKAPINAAPIDVNIGEYNHPSDIWMDDVQIFYKNYLMDHPLADRLNTLLLHRKYREILACLQSISSDSEYIDKKNGVEKKVVPKYKAKMLPEYDVFISHANKDKEELVDSLNTSLKKLGVTVFYDKESLEWGDNWKQLILDGTQKAEFAIIIISEHFFDREWTEKELIEFLNRQNRDGQKIILPILHKITIEQLKDKYPSVSDIQALDSSKFSTDEIALMFGKQLIKRLKMH